MLAENTGSENAGSSRMRRASERVKAGARKVKSGTDRFNQFSDEKVNWQELMKFALAILGFWVAAQFLQGSFLLWIVWSALGLFLLFQVLKFIPVPLFIKNLVKFIVVFGIIVIGVMFIVSGFRTGGWKDLLIGVEETGAEKAVGTSLAKLWGNIIHPERIYEEYRDFDKVDVSEESVKKGIEFFDLRTRRPWFEEEDEITLYGSARITALPDSDTKVAFNCNINDTDIESKDYDPKGKLTLRGIEGNSINVYAGHDEVVSFECKLNGIPLNLSEKARKDKEEDSRTYTSLVEGIYYDFTTTTVLNIYNVKKEEYDLLTDAENLIPNKNLNGRVSSECIEGCGLTTVPLTTDQLIQTEIGSNLLGIALKKDADWYGEIDSVSKIDVRMPDNFQLIACDHFGGDSILDDSDPYLAVLNQDLRDKEYGSARDFSFYCDYNIVRPRVFLGPSEISVDTTYNYKVEGKKAVKIIEKKIISTGNNDNIADPGAGSGSSGEGEGDTRYYYA